MFGKPKEGYGFSRNPPSRMGGPAFASAAFDYPGGAISADQAYELSRKRVSVAGGVLRDPALRAALRTRFGALARSFAIR
ncbi:MAG: DUF2141 domain-containing protein [Hyphomicrobiales bacterium]|nr:DUF2141 domain-containing protein [Hyphomicrobiales bacterium]MBV9907925.1 DUF2141 domain-containing protein [Hyphomicrobiales bacterium]